jgi:PAS domain S-box-containing protein
MQAGRPLRRSHRKGARDTRAGPAGTALGGPRRSFNRDGDSVPTRHPTSGRLRPSPRLRHRFSRSASRRAPLSNPGTGQSITTYFAINLLNYLQALASINNLRRIFLNEHLHNHERLENSQRIAGLGDWVHDFSTGQLSWSDGVYRILGLSRAEVAPDAEAFYRMVHPDDLAAVRRQKKAAAEGALRVDFFHRIVRPDGQIRTIQQIIETVYDDYRRPIREAGTMQDVTERRVSEEALRMQSQVLESMVEGVTVVDDAGVILFSNAAGDAMFGYPRGALIGRQVTTLLELPEDEGQVLVARIREQVQRTGAWSGELPNRKRDGTPFITRARMAPVEIAGKQCIVVVREDITQTKHLESQLLRAQRVESVSRLASGIAHDMNNILAPITMAVSLLRTAAPGTDQMEKLLALIETNANRGASLVKQLLFFGRGIEGHRAVLRLKDSVREIEDIISETFPRSIEIDSHVAEDASPLRADATQIHQVLLNLCVNARDAMPQGGLLSLSAINVNVTEDFPGRTSEATPGPYVRVTVADTGTGIPLADRDKIFDPFYTTKEPGKGTGLGLSTVMAIVKGHGGFVTMDSTVGRGTAFHLYLPALHSPPDAAATGPGEAPPQGQNETVLVVDDEQSIREITCAILTRAGYRVLTANDGAGGAVVFAQHAEEIKVVLTDYDMPVMDGLALIRVLKQIDPAVKVMIATGVQSGFRSEKQVAELAALGVTTTLGKPFSAQSLLSAIHELIGPVPPPTHPPAG